MKRHNLHVHTTYSDGKNSPEELVKKAIESGLEIIGISDHGFTNKCIGLDDKTLPGYLEHLQGLKKEFNGIKILAGLEIDVSRFTGIVPENLPFDILNQLDYVFFENVSGVDKIEEMKGACLESVVSARKKLIIPVGLAHTDFRSAFYGRNGEAIRILGENDIFVELNLAYIPDIKFCFSKDNLELLKKYKVKFTIGTDAHTRDHHIDADSYARDHNIGNINLVMNYILENGLLVHEMVC